MTGVQTCALPICRRQFARRDRVIPMPMPVRWDNSDSWAGFAVRYWFWILIGVFVIGLGTWNFMQGDSTVLDHGVQGAEQRPATPVVQRDPQPVQGAELPKRVIPPEIATSSPVILAILDAGRFPVPPCTWRILHRPGKRQQVCPATPVGPPSLLGIRIPSMTNRST